MQKIIILYQVFLNFFRYAPFDVSYSIFAHALPAVPCADCCPPLQKKSSRWGPLISTSIFTVSRFFDSLAALFQVTYPEISSGGAPQTFVHAVSFGVWKN